MSSGIFEITHDSLAAKIWEKVSAEEKTLIEVRNFITNSAAIYRSRNVLLTKQDLAYIAPYETKLTLDAETLAFINRSKRYYRNQKFGLAGVVTFIMAALLIGIVLISNARRQALTKAAEADSARQMAKEKELEAIKKSDSLSEQTIIANKAVNERVKALEILQTANQNLEQKQLELLNEQKLTGILLQKNDVMVKTIKQQIEDTRNTLENTKLLKQNPTESLKRAINMYDDINEDLKSYLKKNAFDAYKEILYTYDAYFNNVQDIEILYNNKTFLIADGTRLPKIWDITSGSLRSLKGPKNVVTSIVASPVENHFITVENSKELIFWKDFEYQDTADFKDEIIGIDYINQAKELLIGFKNGSLVITNLRGKTILKIPNEKRVDIEEMIVGKSGNYFITRSSDDKIRFWRRKMDNEGTTVGFEDFIIVDGKKSSDGKMASIGKVSSIAASANENLFAMGTESGLHIVNISGDNFSIRLESNLGSISKISFISANKILLLTTDGKGFVYDIENKTASEVKGDRPNIKFTKVKTFRDDRHFVTVDHDSYLTIWDSEINKCWFYQSLKNSDLLVAKKSTERPLYTWMIRDISDKIFDTVYFQSKNRTSAFDTMAVENTPSEETIWGVSILRNDTIIVSSPAIDINGIDFYETINIIENRDTLNIKIADMAGRSTKRRDRLDVQSAIISECKRFILIIIVDRDGKRKYYIHPTFRGLYDLVKTENLFKIK